MNRFLKTLAALTLAMLPSLALAASEGGHEAGGVPTAVIYQTINFLIYVALLFWLLRKPVKAYFANRETAFRQALVKAEAARKDAEARRHEIQQRLTKLQSSTDESLAHARAEAEALKAKIVREAEELAKNLREEARRTAELEIERAKNELREELLNQSVAFSTKILQDKMVEADQKRLQTEFVEKIQVVR